MEEFRTLVKEFMGDSDGDENVKTYVSKVAEEDSLLKLILAARSGNASLAFEKIKAYAEVRFVKYPQMFPETLSDSVKSILERNSIVVLKTVDKEKRRIVINDWSIKIQQCLWDADVDSVEDIITAVCYVMEKMIFDEDGMTNGVVYVNNCEGIGMKYVMQYTINVVRCLMSSCVLDVPYVVKELHYVNVPTIFHVGLTLTKPFIPSEIKLEATPSSKGYSNLEELLPLNFIPQKFGGTEAIEDCIDATFNET